MKSKSKYLNKKVVLDGIKFDSQKEASRYSMLSVMQKTGQISELECHPKFYIIPSVKWNGKTLCKRSYSADFKYVQDGKIIVEDVKSPATAKKATYTLKRQLFLHQYGAEYVFIES